MNDIEKLDYTLKALYHSTKDGGMLKIIKGFSENGHSLTIDELRNIKSILEAPPARECKMMPARSFQLVPFIKWHPAIKYFEEKQNTLCIKSKKRVTLSYF